MELNLRSLPTWVFGHKPMDHEFSAIAQPNQVENNVNQIIHTMPTKKGRGACIRLRTTLQSTKATRKHLTPAPIPVKNQGNYEKNPDNSQVSPHTPKGGEGGVIHRSLKKPPHNERTQKTTPIRSESCQKEYLCNTKTAISGSHYNPPKKPL